MTNKTVLAALAACLISATAVAATPDRAVGRLLDSLDFPYEVDEDGDYKMVFDAGDDRTQLVFVRSSVEKFGSHHVREIWSPAYRSATSSLPVGVANRLLEDSNDAKLGGWVRQQGTAMFVVKIDADAPATALGEAIEAAIRSADAMEKELTGRDEF